MTTSLAIRLIASLSLFCIYGCASTASNWDRASSINTVAAYEEFLKENPGSEYNSQAKDNLRTAQFTAAQNEKTVIAVNEFLALYPEGEDSTILRNQLPDIQNWENIRILADILIRMAPRGSMQVAGGGEFHLNPVQLDGA